jgi:hypothetical protein
MMPSKKKPIKKSVKAKVAKKPKSQSEKKRAPKLMLAKKPQKNVQKSMQKKKAASPPSPKSSGGNIFWKVLEMRKQEREARKGEASQFESKDPRHVYSDKHSRFARFAGPRRRAA